MATGAHQIISLRPKVVKRFYEPLVLLHALDRIRGERIKSEIVPDDTGTNHTQLRRAFADAIASICAYKKEPDYVTAAALAMTPQGVVVWLAANSKVEGEVVEFLETVLATVQKVAEQDDMEDRQQAAVLAIDKLSSKITNFQIPRLEVYHAKIITDLIKPCQEVLAEYRKEDVSSRDKGALQINNLQTWLREYFEPESEEFKEPSFLDLANACHKIRHTQYMKTISMFAGQGETRRQEFAQLYKLLGKLGRPIIFSHKLIEGALKLSQELVQGIKVKKIPSSRPLPLPFRGKKDSTILSIAGRMFSNQTERDSFMNRLSYLEGGEIEEFIQREKSTETRVHAELLLLDHFEKAGCLFLDGNDKYIGCSKAACYLCHMYIAQHPGRYVVPGTHNKLYIGWRPPDVFVGDTGSAASAVMQEKILLKMIDIVRRDLTTEIGSRTLRRPFRPDSTAGITSTLSSLSVDRNRSPWATFPEFQGESAASVQCAEEAAEQSDLQDSDSEGGVLI